jgi:P-type Ca2+ transporter type 2C
MKHEVWYQQKTKDVFLSLQSQPSGLTPSEADLRLKKYGQNKLPEKNGHSWKLLLLSQVKSPLVYVLFGAALLSFFVGETVDVVVILFVVLLNTFVGFWQEYKADRSIQQLQGLIKQFATVIRGTETMQIPSSQLVIGDILILESGDKVTADARIFESNNLQVNEAALTGEAFPVNKQVDVLGSELSVGDRTNMVFMGTSIARGRGKAIIVATAEGTQIGEIASLVKETEEGQTPLQVQLGKVSQLLTVVVISLSLLLIVIGYLKDFAIQELLLTAAALAVAAIPEGLLVSLTLVLAFGMRRILKRKALVRKLLAAETLGSVSIVCSDKTGTITQGIMQVDQLLIGGEKHDKFNQSDSKPNGGEAKLHLLALKLIGVCNNAYLSNPEEKLNEWIIKGDSTDSALLKAALQSGFSQKGLKQEYLRLDEIPFHETYKYHATLHQSSEGPIVFAKGAPESILALCSHYIRGKSSMALTQKSRDEINKEYQQLTKKGLRVLALAYDALGKKQVLSFDDLISNRDDPKLEGLTFLGWVALKDPVREEVAKSFLTMRKAGIRTVIITGDHKYTVQAIVAELGLKVPEKRIMIGSQLEELTENQLLGVIDKIDIFARVAPKHKLRIINAWKAKGEVVAMLGDGVNDAPALKAADIGIAIGDATDVAKETSDMILLDGNFAVVEAAIREGRIIFDNIRRSFLYLMSDSFTEIFLIALALFSGYPIPLIAIHILWINIASDGVVNLALTVEPAEGDVMAYPPRKKDERIVSREIITLISILTIVAVAFMYGLFVYIYNSGASIEYVRTLVFTAFAVDSAIYVYSLKSLRKPLWKTNMFSNPWLLLATFTTIMVQVAIVNIPLIQGVLKTVSLSLRDWGFVFLLGIVGIMVREIIKWAYWHNKLQTKTN